MIYEAIKQTGVNILGSCYWGFSRRYDKDLCHNTRSLRWLGLVASPPPPPPPHPLPTDNWSRQTRTTGRSLIWRLRVARSLLAYAPTKLAFSR